MAEFMEHAPHLWEKPKHLELGEGQGFAAFGQWVPPNRRAEGYALAKAMVPKLSNEDAWTLVNAMSDRIGRDDPYGAMQVGMRYLDLTGTYRLMAVLCCDPSQGSKEEG